MALIKCPECGKKISDFTDKCTHCGKPITEDDKIHAFVEQQKRKKQKKVMFIISWAIGIVIVIFCVILTMGAISRNLLDKDLGNIFKDDGSTSITSSAEITSDWMSRVVSGKFISLSDVEDEWVAKDKEAK